MVLSPRVPLTVIGGFLGAGKTTLLNHLLSQSNGQRLAVLVNDFGALNIDAELVASNAGDTVALTNGCVCCSIGDDLSAALIRVLDTRPPFDGVVIEASGVSDPWRIAQIGLAAPELVLEGVWVLVDASAVLQQANDPLLADALQRQLQAADRVVINKADLAGEHTCRQVQAWVQRVAGPVPLFTTSQAVVPLPLLSGRALKLGAVQTCQEPGCTHAGHGHSGEHTHGHIHGHTHADLFETWSLSSDRVHSVQALRQALKNMPPGVLRLKGLLRTDEHGWSELQFCGRHGSLSRLGFEPGHTAGVVAIGLRQQLPRASLDALFSAHPLQE